MAKKELIPIQLTECPNCGAQWCMEEFDWQECYGCGYPETDAFSEEEDEDGEIDDDEY
jgi:ribosomal protein S27AE